MPARAFDTENPRGTLKRFYPDITEIIDLNSVADQMKILDTLDSAAVKVTIVDLKAGNLSSMALDTFDRIGVLEAARHGQFDLGLIHVVGPSVASLDEINEISDYIKGINYVIARNFINETNFFEWDEKTFKKYFADLPDATEIDIPKLNEMAYEQVDLAGVTFSDFVENKDARGADANFSFVSARLCPQVGFGPGCRVQPSQPAAKSRPRPAARASGQSPRPSRSERQRSRQPVRIRGWSDPVSFATGEATRASRSPAIGANIHIICSDEARNGKTIFARLYAELLRLGTDDLPRIVDTDYPNGTIGRYFGRRSAPCHRSVQHGRSGAAVRQHSGEPAISIYVIDLEAHHLERFFSIFDDIGYEKAAAAAGMGVAVFFSSSIAHWPRSRRPIALRKLLSSSQFVLVRNDAIGAFRAPVYGEYDLVKIGMDKQIRLPALSADALDFVEDPSFNFTDFIMQRRQGLPEWLNDELWRFLETIYQQQPIGTAESLFSA